MWTFTHLEELTLKTIGGTLQVVSIFSKAKYSTVLYHKKLPLIVLIILDIEKSVQFSGRPRSRIEELVDIGQSIIEDFSRLWIIIY